MSFVDMLRERNKLYGTIKFVDISSGDYSQRRIKGWTIKLMFMKVYMKNILA
ncbi:hypothetical protein Pyn_11838 [Prunus yedoensis var. nudiflora]|uniref:Uncharacterized protein n=1 Tax=Prunus yedoensis var. nudiflora TaxID=2094558 RepID=A0A314YEV4_PRUYE|nr:hypothetical protein Pyn_11838 [Prunus yedoensis var. nudiflora]